MFTWLKRLLGGKERGKRGVEVPVMVVTVATSDKRETIRQEIIQNAIETLAEFQAMKEQERKEQERQQYRAWIENNRQLFKAA